MAIGDLLRDSKFKMFGRPFKQGDSAPALSWNVFKGNVGISVYTNSESDTNPEKWIKAPMSYVVMGELFTVLRALAGVGPLANVIPRSVVIENNQGNKDENGERVQGMSLVSSTHVGIDEKGIIWIMVVDADESRPQIKFQFGADMWHNYRDGDTGQPLSADMVSRLHCLSLIEGIKDVVPHLIVDQFADGEKSAVNKHSTGENAGQAGGGNNSYQGGGNNNYRNNQQGGGNWNRNGGGGGWKGNNGGGGNWKGNGGGGNWKGNGGGYNNNRGGGGGNWNRGQGGGGGNYQGSNGGGYNRNQNGGTYQQGGQGGSSGGESGGGNGLDDKLPF